MVTSVHSRIGGLQVSQTSPDPWDDFDPRWYVNRNYAELREDDLTILCALQDLFADAELPESAAGVDVGCGPNLYPALTMLPYCDTITLWEYAAPNIAWLDNEVPSYSVLWDPFWDVLAAHPRYGLMDQPRAALAARAIVTKGSVFELPEHQWDIGTMLFVSESISERWNDFRAAMLGFSRALKPEATFAVAFMEGSQGYSVGRNQFPAVSIGVDDVHQILQPTTDQLEILRIGLPSRPLRAGYSGMILATGRAGGD